MNRTIRPLLGTVTILAALLSAGKANAQGGDNCAAATVAVVGTNTTAGLVAGSTYQTGCYAAPTGPRAKWFVYTAGATTETVQVRSCNMVPTGVDTRVSVFSVTSPCTGFACLDSDDDACSTPGNGYASDTGPFTVCAGQTIYIQWDNRWSPTGFNWELLSTPFAGCITPTASAATAITSTTANANYTTSCPPGTWLVEYGPSAIFTTPGTAGTPGLNGTIIVSSGSPQAITGLTPSTGYRYFVRRDCGAGVYSSNSSGITFTTLAPPPPNDACSAAITIACTPTPVGGTTVNSTMDAEYTNCGAGVPGGSGQNGVWYKIIGDNNQYTITTCDPGGLGYDTRLTVYSGSCGALGCVTGNDDMTPSCATGSYRSRVNFPANLGTDYYVFVHGIGSPSATGTFNLHITCTPLCLPTPANDLCSTATTLVVDAAATSDDNLCANATPGNPTCESGFATLPDVWYGFTASAGGTNLLVINLGTATSMGYAIYSLTCGGAQVFCNASVTSGATNTLTGLTPGAPYFIRVETDELTTGTFDIRVSSPCQPDASPVVVPSCGTNEFSIDVTVTNMGTATSVDVTTDFVGDTEPTVFAPGLVTIGPYPSGTTVIITLEHDSDPLCDKTLAGVTYTCPPPNDLCTAAIAIACNSVTAGTTISATTEAPAPPFCGTSVTTAGVWYTVVGTGGSMTASLCTALAYDTKIGVYTTPDCIAYTCVMGNDDFCALGSQVSWASTLGTTYHILVHGFGGATGPFVLEVVCTGLDVPPCADNTVELELQTDGFGSETTWEIIPFGNTLPVCGDLSGTYPGTSTILESCCLIDGCYELFVYDSFGDGMCCSYGNGGYVLRTGGGDRIIDNGQDGDFGTTSTVGLPFCLPIGTDALTIATCDRNDLLPTSVIVADENLAVSAQYGVTDATSGYQFWFFDPDGGFNRRIFLSHDHPGLGGGSGATKACHLKLTQVVSPSVPTMTDLNVRVRGRIAGVYNEFGPACRLRVDATNAACPSTQLDGNPLHIGTTYSCGVTGKTVGASGYAGKIYANPVLSQPGNVVACKYRFVLTVPAEGFTRQITINSYALTLGAWVATPLLCGTFTYDVTVQASFDCTTYCPVGATCTVEITNPGGAIPCTAPFGGGGGSLNSAAVASGDLLIYPNPNNGDQLVLMMSELPSDLEEVTVDIYDAFGRVAMSRTIAVGGGEMNHVLDLDGSLANGMYTVNLTAGGTIFTERLVIQ